MKILFFVIFALFIGAISFMSELLARASILLYNKLKNYLISSKSRNDISD